MSDCIDTIRLGRPLEGATTWLFRGALSLARAGDRIVLAVFRMALQARERTAQRHMLAALDERMLKDLGLSRADVEQECRKPFWVR